MTLLTKCIRILVSQIGDEASPPDCPSAKSAYGGTSKLKSSMAKDVDEHIQPSHRPSSDGGPVDADIEWIEVFCTGEGEIGTKETARHVQG
jgi:hypothetical protein